MAAPPLPLKPANSDLPPPPDSPRSRAHNSAAGEAPLQLYTAAELQNAAMVDVTGKAEKWMKATNSHLMTAYTEAKRPPQGLPAEGHRDSILMIASSNWSHDRKYAAITRHLHERSVRHTQHYDTQMVTHTEAISTVRKVKLASHYVRPNEHLIRLIRAGRLTQVGYALPRSVSNILAQRGTEVQLGDSTSIVNTHRGAAFPPQSLTTAATDWPPTCTTWWAEGATPPSTATIGPPPSPPHSSSQPLQSSTHQSNSIKGLTRMRREVWEDWLNRPARGSSDPSTSFASGHPELYHQIIDGITNGVRVNYSGSRTAPRTAHNPPLVDDEEAIAKMDTVIAEDVASGKKAGPFDEPPMLSFCVFPHQPCR